MLSLSHSGSRAIDKLVCAREDMIRAFSSVLKLPGLNDAAHRHPPSTSANVHPGVQNVIFAKFLGNATLSRRGGEVHA
nr:unnamed protein product [Spirometra erinaceieuropaei]